MITCWFCQKVASLHLDGNSALPNWARNHIRQCPACREDYQSATAIIQQLSATATDQKRVEAPFLHGRIMSAVRSSENIQIDTQCARSRVGWVMAVGMACLLAASIVWLRPPFRPDQNVPKTPAAFAELALNVKLPSVVQVDQWTKTLDVPLEQETKLVLRDATAAIHTLAQGFLPEDLLASSTEPAQQ